MLRHRLRLFWLSSLLLATAPSLASAQGSEVTHDTTDATPTASAQREGRNWFVSLMRKIGRRSDDTEPTSSLATPASSDTESTIGGDSSGVVPESAMPSRRVARNFKSRKDSLEWRAARAVAQRSTGYRVIIDLFARELYVLDRDDTLRVAPAATAMNATLAYGGRTWRFETPRGVRTVRGKDKDPAWTPPEWHFAEVALEHGLKLRSMSARPADSPQGRHDPHVEARRGRHHPQGREDVRAAGARRARRVRQHGVHPARRGRSIARSRVSWATTGSTSATATCCTARRTRARSAPR